MNLYKVDANNISNAKVQETVDFVDPEYFAIFNWWRWYDLGVAFFALVGLIMALVNYEVDIQNKTLKIYDV